MPRSRGFTLIELMIAVAIVAILAAIAIPSYSEYIRRSRITEAISALSGMRVKMEQFFHPAPPGKKPIQVRVAV